MSRQGMIETFDNADWASLKTSTGAGAGNVPDLLLGLTADRASSRQESWEELAGLLATAHCSAGAAALPVLVEIAAQPRQAQRRAILVLAADVIAAPHWAHAARGLDGDLGEQLREGAGALVADAARVVREQVLELLESDDVSVRAAASMVLAFVPDDRRGSLDAVAAAIASEPNELGCAAMIISFGVLASGLADVDWSAVHVRGDSSAVAPRGAAELAQLAQGDEVSAAVREFLMLGSRTPDEFCWNDGALDFFAYTRVREVLGADAATTMLFAVLETVGVDEENSGWWALWILRMHLEPSHDLRAPSELDESQLEIVRRLSEVDWQASFENFGIPGALELRRRWLGLGEADGLDIEVEIDGVRMPAWLAAYRVGPQGWCQHIFDALDPMTCLSVFERGAALKTLHGVNVGVPAEWWGKVCDALGPAALQWARDYIETWARAEDEGDERFCANTREAIAAALGVVAEQTDAELDERWYSCFSFYAAPVLRRAVAQKLPTAVLEARVTALLDRWAKRRDIVVRLVGPVFEYAATPAVIERFGPMLADVQVRFVITDALLWIEPAAAQNPAIAAMLRAHPPTASASPGR